jgi:two-component system sensor histidine kinase/response regulator
MSDKKIIPLLSNWAEEFKYMSSIDKSIYFALFSIEKELLFANNAMIQLNNGKLSDSLINPTFDELLELENSAPLIFDGILTLGDFLKDNISVSAQVFRKNDQLFILGCIDGLELLKQNQVMHNLNKEISSLQRALMKEKFTLQNTLSQLEHANQELSQVNANKDKFIAILVHELRSPFNGILGFLSTLEEDINLCTTEELGEQLSYINDAAKSTYHLLEDTLSWVMAESGQIPYLPEEFDLEEISNRIIKDLSLNANIKNIDISYVGLPQNIISADIKMVSMLLRNLISNALKFSNEGGSIKIDATVDAMETTVIVSDNGIGIPVETIPKIFDIAEKVTTKGTANEKGTGLGLLICKEFIERHGGKICVESTVGVGSDFKFTIPIHLKK